MRILRKYNLPSVQLTCLLTVTIFCLGESIPFSGSEDDDDDDTSSSTAGMIKHHHIHGQIHPGTPETNNNSLSAGDLQGPLGHAGTGDSKTGQDDSEDQGKTDLLCSNMINRENYVAE